MQIPLERDSGNRRGKSASHSSATGQDRTGQDSDRRKNSNISAVQPAVAELSVQQQSDQIAASAEVTAPPAPRMEDTRHLMPRANDPPFRWIGSGISHRPGRQADHRARQDTAPHTCSPARQVGTGPCSIIAARKICEAARIDLSVARRLVDLGRLAERGFRSQRPHRCRQSPLWSNARSNPEGLPAAIDPPLLRRRDPRVHRRTPGGGMTYTGPIAREATARQSSAAPRPPQDRPGPDATPAGNAASRPAKPKPEARAHEWDRTGRMRTCLACGAAAVRADEFGAARRDLAPGRSQSLQTPTQSERGQKAVTDNERYKLVLAAFSRACIKAGLTQIADRHPRRTVHRHGDRHMPHRGSAPCADLRSRHGR